ncbi:hypothetical protein [uncultured Shewanella sp.]|uniref:hypothetical protein n=1 Tax=uncultured Shewanella sp. TaxID=173975 RepID=UPI00261D78EC|nr:hypothetical protein [uncultured Shewanella sp.]
MVWSNNLVSVLVSALFMPLRLVILLSMFVFISACSSTTGGDIAGLFPAPKFTDGDIRQDRYFSPNGDFSIALPHKEETYEYRYMQMKEQFSKESDYVSFGPAAMDRSIYRMLIVKKISLQSQQYTQDEAVQILFDNYLAQLGQSQLEPRLISKKSVEVNGLNGGEWLFSQSSEGNELLNQFIIINEKTRVLLFGEQWLKTDEDKPRLSLMAFAQSFQMMPPK